MKQNIDTYFKEKLLHREFEMNNAHWQDAIDLLDAADKKKRRGSIFWWTSGAFVIIAIAALFILNTVENPVNSEIKTANIIAEKEKRNSDNVSTKEKATPVFENKNVESNSIIEKGITKKTVSIDEKQKKVKSEELFNEKIEIINTGINRLENLSEKEKSTNKFSLAAISNLFILVHGDFDEKPEREMNPQSACFKPNPFHIGVTASQLMQSFPENGEYLITGYSGGIAVQYDVNKNWFIASGIEYLRKNGHFHASKMTETRNYRFGLELMENEMRPSSLQYISAPMKVGRQKGHHLFEGGFIFDYLSGVRGEIGKLEKANPDINKKEFVVQEKGWIKENGFTTFNISPTIGYRYRVNRELSLGIAAQFSLKRIADEAAMGDYILKENDRLQIRAQAVYLLNE